jgi:hypothetical protein
MTDDENPAPDHASEAFAAALAEGLATHWDQMTPLADMLAEATAIPLDPAGCHRPCWCPCTTAHPGEDSCDMEAVTTRRIGHAIGEWVDVPVCAPCEAACLAATAA